jgi:hypothetical protein
MVEGNTDSVFEEFEEQRCIVEAQQVEIRRQQHRIEMQRRRIDLVEAELAAIKATLQRATPNRPRTQRRPKPGNGRPSAPQFTDDTMSSSHTPNG